MVRLNADGEEEWGSSEESDEGSEEVANSGLGMRMFWQELGKASGHVAAMPEWFKAASLVLYMVPGSVNEESMFSAMKYSKNLWRNWLDGVHLTVCAHLFGRAFKWDEEQIKAAFKDWDAVCKVRSRYGAAEA